MKTPSELGALRRLTLADEHCLRAFFQSHTKDTVYLRYGYHVSEMTSERAKSLLGVDQEKDVALGVFQDSGAGPLLDAVGRYYTETPDTAEMALVVRENLRRRGLGTVLFLELARIAWEHGLRFFRAQVLLSNLPMRRFLQRYGAQVSYLVDTDAIHYTVPIEKVLPFTGVDPEIGWTRRPG